MAKGDHRNPVDRFDQKCSGGVYPRLNGGSRRCPQTNLTSDVIDVKWQGSGGDKHRHYNGSSLKWFIMMNTSLFLITNHNTE
jgi:hypothetical protein